MLKRIALGLGLALAILIAVVLVRTFAYRPPAAGDLTGVRVSPPVAVDVGAVAQHLSQAIQIPTVRHQDPAEDDDAAWTRLHAFLATAYPAAHAAMRREELASRTLVYSWAGSDPKLAPIILMAHQDVVPVTAGTEGEWKHSPFSGDIADGAVWGRGAIDDKGSLIPIFEALETLARKGFKPRRTVILVSGGDEEVRGQGAKAAAALLKARGVMAQYVLDEGMAVISDNPVSGGRVALIGTAEKGYGTLIVTAKATGGHSSTPPADGGGVVALSRAISTIAERPFSASLDGPTGEMLRTLAPQAPFVLRMAIANEWLFAPLIKSQLGASSAGNALMRTTIAATMLKGSPKENVLPQDATAWINYRLAPGDSSVAVMARAKAAVGDLPVTLAWARPPEEATRVASTSSAAWKAIAATAQAVTGAPAAPNLVLGGTDSRYLEGVSRDTYRFQPLEFPLADMEMIHGTNEHVTLQSLERAVQFYARLIATTAG